MKTILYDELIENDLQYFKVKENARRKMGTRKHPFFIDGNSKVQEYKGNEFIDYSFRNSSRKDLQCVEKMRKSRISLSLENLLEKHIIWMINYLKRYDFIFVIKWQ